MNITVAGGKSKKLLTGGKYCPEDITVTAEGAAPPASEVLDPDEVYRTTRPADWLPMPTPGDDEIYLLGHIPSNLDGAFTATISTFSNCTIAIGNLADGAFVAKESITPTHNVRLYRTIYAADYGDETAEGYKQYLVRIKGDFKRALCYPENDTVYGYGVPMLVDAVIGKEVDVRFGVNTTPRHNCEHLRYCRFVGNGALTSLSGFNYRSCSRLLSVSAEKEHTCTYMNYMFSGCKSLLAISGNMLISDATYNYTFYDAIVPILPKKHFQPTAVSYCFRGSIVLQTLDGQYFDTSQCTSFSNFAYNAQLCRLLNLNISSATDVMSLVANTPLVELTFAGETTPGGWTIDAASSKMSHKALVNMINSLPTAAAAATITITGSPGASELTEAEIAVATAKNWTITI